MTGDDGGAGVGQHPGEVVDQPVGERRAVTAGDEMHRLLDPARQFLVEVPPDERWDFSGEAVAAITFGTFQTFPAKRGFDDGPVVRSAQRRQEGVESGG